MKPSFAFDMISPLKRTHESRVDHIRGVRPRASRSLQAAPGATADRSNDDPESSFPSDGTSIEVNQHGSCPPTNGRRRHAAPSPGRESWGGAPAPATPRFPLLAAVPFFDSCPVSERNGGRRLDLSHQFQRPSPSVSQSNPDAGKRVL